MQLRTLCDSVLHTHLSKVADTLEKRNYLHALYTAVYYGLRPGSFQVSVDTDTLVQVLELYPPTFQPCNDLLLVITSRNVTFLLHYLGNFLWNSERSRLFYCDPALWSTFVATRIIRYLRARPRERLHPRWAIQFKGVRPKF